MPNAKDADLSPAHRILIVGKTGSGKTAQIWTLPGRKFAYIFDPNSLSTLKGLDLDYELFQPDFSDMDATLKGFNKNPATGKQYVGDKPAKKKEPHVYMKWIDHINNGMEKGFFLNYDWLIFDSLTFLNKALMDRQLYINNRYGDVEDQADYRVVGSKMTEVFNSISALPMNVYATGHFNTFQDEKTKKIDTQIMLAGKARNYLPLMFTNIWLSDVEESERGQVKYTIRTKPDPRGLKDVRSSIQGLNTIEDVTIRSFGDLASGGIGALLQRTTTQVPKLVATKP
jgi:hypothetical protein